VSFALIPGLPTVGGPELIILLVVVLLLFGAKRIPELAKGIGSGVREFKKGVSGESSEEKKDEELAADKDKDDTRAQEETAHTEHVGGRTGSAEQAQHSEQKH
jgi:sec-independent protein translocase protein TatA